MADAKLFVVSGAGSGIGQAISQKICDQGHFVLGLGRTPGKLEKVKGRLGERFSFVVCDLASTAGREQAVQGTLQSLSVKKLKLNGIVNNAGVFDRVAFVETVDEIWERQFHANLLSAVGLTRGLFAALKDGAPSSVLNISSTLGLQPVSHTSAYSAIKAAMVNWTKALAIEGAAHGIRANCICPGLVNTPIHPAPPPAQAQPLGRVGEPEDISEAAWFLLSERSSWTTGAVLSVDGGISL